MIQLDKQYVLIWGAETVKGHIYTKEKFPIDIEKKYFVIMDQPTSFSINIKDIACSTKVGIDDVGVYIENFKVLDTPNGRILQTLYNFKYNIHLAPVAMGTSNYPLTNVFKFNGFYVLDRPLYHKLPAKIIKKQRQLKLKRIKCIK